MGPPVASISGMSTAEQVVHYTGVGGRTVAWSSVGTGPPLVIGGWWASHLELNWRDHAFRSFVLSLARNHTVIRYDRPGTGLSDRDGPPPVGLADELEILTGLLDRIDLPRLSLLGASSAGAVASCYAAEKPDRVDRLVLYGTFARGADITSPSAQQLMISLVEGHWGLGARVLADVFLPHATPKERDDFVEFQRRSASRQAASIALGAVYSMDCADQLARVRLPTLVLHRRDDRAIPFALGREIADTVPGAMFVELRGDDHFPWLGDSAAVLDAIDRFLAGLPQRARVEHPGPPSLTAREREILALVAEGLTDVQIAQMLVLSAHTVHRHIANVRTKLGVASRAAAAAWVLSHPD